ncbi:MAG: thioesterase family protein [Gemmatimonadota bacterium]|jgi:acyl-CoA thioester hydrolase
MSPPDASVPVSETVIEVRSPELDSFGHVNHAVFLNYLEHARYLKLEEAGFDWSSLDELGQQIFVVRLEIDYVAEATRGDRLLIRTWADAFRRTQMVFGQEIVRENDPDTVVARARVTGVWIGPSGRPTRVPEHVRRGLSGEGPAA